MVKKSKKSKSKRVPLRKKYKIIKKVKEHHKKQAKEAKQQAGKGRKAVEKDPGIPAAWPFREQELAALEARRQRTLEEIEKKKVEKKERAVKRRNGVLEEEEEVAPSARDVALAELAKKAKEQDAEFEKRKRQRKEYESGAPLSDGSKRAFYKEFQKVVEASDVIIQVLDARDPIGCRCTDVEKMVLKSGAHKRVVLLLNKIDLVPREVAEKWLKYLREELPTVAFKCSTQSQKSNLGQKKGSLSVSDALQSSQCLGADTLLQLLKNYSRNQKIKTSVTVGVVGFPNVGKSSLINSLKRTRVANVGATPGLTKSMQEVHLDKNVKLLDCPGIVFASATRGGEGDGVGSQTAAALRNAVRVEKLEDPVTPVRQILKLCETEVVMGIYKIARFDGVDEFLRSVAFARGKLKKGGVADPEAAARVVLMDWNQGKIPYYTLPPQRESALSEHAGAAIVSDWGKEFDAEEVFKNEESTVIAGLPSLAEGNFSELPSSAPPLMDVDGMEEDEEEGEEDEEEEDGEDGEDGEEEEEEDWETGKGANGGENGVTSMEVGEGKKPLVHAARGQKFLNQNDKLYEAEGILKPSRKKADKKARKKATRNGVVNEEDDYDFADDFEGEEEGMDGVEGGMEGKEENGE